MVTKEGVEPAATAPVVLISSQASKSARPGALTRQGCRGWRYPSPVFTRTRPDALTLKRSSRAQSVFFDYLDLVYSGLRLSTRAFLGHWSRVCGWRICEKQKTPLLSVVIQLGITLPSESADRSRVNGIVFPSDKSLTTQSSIFQQ